MGCSFLDPVQDALGSQGLGLPGAEVIAPVVAGAVLGPAAGALLGTSATVGAAAAGAATGAIGSAASGGNLLTGAITGGLGGLAGGTIGGALGIGGGASAGTAAAAGGTVGDMAAIYQNAYGMSVADAMAAAESAMSSGMLPGQLAATVADAGLLTGAQIASLTGNAALGSSSLLSDAANVVSNVPGTSGSSGTTNSLSQFLKDPSWGGAGSLIADNLGNLTNAGLGLYGQYQAGQAAKDIAAQNAALQKPWLDAGTNALAQITPGIQPGGEFRKDYTVADYQQDPYNKWLQSQGSQAIQRSAAAKGTLGSGNVLAELSKYNQNVAGAGFADQWNREQTGTANKFNRLASVAQLGQQAPANVMAGNAFAASEGAKAKTGMTNTLSNLFNSWQGA